MDETPQLENGYCKIANELMEALSKYRIPGEQMQCLLFLLRKTYGYNKKSDRISNSQFVVGTGINKRNVKRAIDGLIEKRIVVKKDNEFIPTYQFNKDYRLWQKLSKKTTVVKFDHSVVKKDNKQLSKKTPTKDNKDNIQKTEEIYNFYLQEISPEHKSKQRAILNLKSHLRKYSEEDLKASILNYKKVSLKSEPQFRKDPANFFGKNEPYFKDFLPDVFVSNDNNSFDSGCKVCSKCGNSKWKRLTGGLCEDCHDPYANE